MKVCALRTIFKLFPKEIPQFSILNFQFSIRRLRD